MSLSRPWIAHDLRAMLEPASGGSKRARLTVSHDDDVVRPDEHLDLAELHGLLFLDIPGRLVDGEHHVVIDLELRPLMRLDRILDRQLVELELPPHRVELLLRRLVEPDPHECVLGVARGGQLVERQLAGPASPVLIQRAVDNHGPIVAPLPAVARSESDRHGRPRGPRPRSWTRT
jgi:hypothetical protein